MRHCEWIEPRGRRQQYAVVMSMAFDEIVGMQREVIKRYTKENISDEDVFMDFVVVNWGKIIEKDDIERI